MNFFRLIGDMMHLASIFILLYKMIHQKSCAGVSLRSQLCYALVFITRYLDLFYFVSVYNTLMKVFFLISSIAVVYLMRTRYANTYDRENDIFPLWYLMAPCAALSIAFTSKYTFLEILWTFSQYLEAVSIMPQLYMLQRTGGAETLTSHYLFALGGYRGMYILNWIYRFNREGPSKISINSVVAGIVQTALYCDFFYHYFTKVMRGKRFVLPQ